MSDVQREMTLEEWVGKLPDIHLAHREYTDLRARPDRAVALLRRAHAFVQEPEQMANEYDAGLDDEIRALLAEEE